MNEINLNSLVGTASSSLIFDILVDALETKKVNINTEGMEGEEVIKEKIRQTLHNNSFKVSLHKTMLSIYQEDKMAGIFIEDEKAAINTMYDNLDYGMRDLIYRM